MPRPMVFLEAGGTPEEDSAGECNCQSPHRTDDEPLSIAPRRFLRPPPARAAGVPRVGGRSRGGDGPGDAGEGTDREPARRPPPAPPGGSGGPGGHPRAPAGRRGALGPPLRRLAPRVPPAAGAGAAPRVLRAAPPPLPSPGVGRRSPVRAGGSALPLHPLAAAAGSGGPRRGEGRRRRLARGGQGEGADPGRGPALRGRGDAAMTAAIVLLVIQGLMGAFDTLYYHEYRLRVPAAPGAAQ